MSSDKWITKKGKKLKPSEMSTTHLYNASRMLEERGVQIYPFIEELHNQIATTSQTFLSPRVQLTIKLARKIVKWLLIFRDEMRRRDGVEGLNALQTYDQHFSIIEGSPFKQLQPRNPQIRQEVVE